MKLIVLICFACLGSACAQTQVNIFWERVIAFCIQSAEGRFDESCEEFMRTQIKTSVRSNVFREMIVAAKADTLAKEMRNSSIKIATANDALSKTNLGPLTFTNNNGAVVRGAWITETGYAEAKYRPADGLGGGWVKVERLPAEVHQQLAYEPKFALARDYVDWRAKKDEENKKFLEDLQRGLTASEAQQRRLSGQPQLMPAKVAAEIKAAAIKRWPGDYTMQAYEINKQTEAWHKVND